MNGTLSSGYQTAQVAHVAAEYCFMNPEEAKQWDTTSGSLIVLETVNAEELYQLWEEATKRNIKTHIFREPDIGDEITAILFTPGESTVKLLSNLPCAGKTTEDDKKKRRVEITKRRQVDKMQATEQAKGQNILEHGRSVREHYLAILEHLQGKIDLNSFDNWKLPEWVDSYREPILANLPSLYVMDRYLTLHDCGKPDVIIFDENGRKHFPNHAEASEKAYNKYFSSGSVSDIQVSQMIRDDMMIHMLKAVGVPEFCENPNAVGHLIAGLAELTSNAAMFGGIESDGFKMKYSALNQRGKAICKLLFENGDKK